MEQTEKDQAAVQPKPEAAKIESNEQGRELENARKSAEKNEDISQIDRQEGEMENGELGGNFDTNAANGNA